LGIATCTSDELQTNPIPLPLPEEEPELMEVVTKAPVDLSNPEDSVAGVRWIVLSNPGAKVLVNQYIDADSIAKLTTNHFAEIIFRALLPGGYADFFMIANERSNWNLGSYAVGSTLLPQTLKEGKMIDYSPYFLVTPKLPSLPVGVNHLIPMAGIYEHVYVAGGQTYTNSDKVTPVDVGKVDRLYAKVTFKLTALISDQLNDGDSIDIKKIAIINMPEETRLAPYLYPHWAYNSGEYVEPTAANYVRFAPNPSSTPGTDSIFRGVFLFYIPEYFLRDTAKYTYASVWVNLRDDVDAEREYKIVVGNGIKRYIPENKNNAWLLNPASADRGVLDLRITRNTHYYFDASIINFDLRGEQEIEIRPKILDWGVTPVDSAYIRDYYLTVGQDKFVVPSASSFDGVIRVTTDYTDGWSAAVTPSGAYTTVTAPATFPVPTGDLRFTYSGTAFGSSHPADTISITAGALTKKIIITNP
jgi:hypothetical protein